jgi:hypothetical protein
MARKLKRSGLDWIPQVGCFVWDPEEVIESPSPFPCRTYFVLNLDKFLRIFGSTENMIEKLVWLPTWYQARLVAAELGLDLAFGRDHPADELRILYDHLLKALQVRQRQTNHGDDHVDG